MVKVYEKTASTRKKQFLERSPGAETPSGNKYTACVWEFGRFWVQMAFLHLDWGHLFRT